MNNRAPFAALVVAFTCAGAAIGYGLRDTPDTVAPVIAVLAIIGGCAAFISGEKMP